MSQMNTALPNSLGGSGTIQNSQGVDVIRLVEEWFAVSPGTRLT